MGISSGRWGCVGEEGGTRFREIVRGLIGATQGVVEETAVLRDGLAEWWRVIRGLGGG